MSRLGRTLVLALVTTAVVLGLTSPAGAALSDKAAMTSSVTALTVAPATDVTARLNSCNNARWMDVTVSWTASATTRGISGYQVQAHRDGQITTVADVDATASAVSITVDKFTANSPTVYFSVTTLTTYGWTAESVTSEGIRC